jgi:hypothetical protein
VDRRRPRTRPLVAKAAARAANRIGYGDYEGLAVARGFAHPIWADARAGS